MTKAEIIELCAESVHDKWVATKIAQGITSRPAEDGTEQIAPYASLPEHIKDLDRGSVAAVVDVLVLAGLLSVAAEAPKDSRPFPAGLRDAGFRVDL